MVIKITNDGTKFLVEITDGETYSKIGEQKQNLSLKMSFDGSFIDVVTPSEKYPVYYSIMDAQWCSDNGVTDNQTLFSTLYSWL